jgi:Short C-terminal domain
MGFMRKAFIVGTGGLGGVAVNPNSKKERSAKAAEKQVRLQKQMLAGARSGSVGAPVVARLSGKQEGWLNEVSAALAGSGLKEIGRNTGSQLRGIPMEADIAVAGSNFRAYINLFDSPEHARQAELGLTAKPDVQRAMSRGRSAVRRVDRLLYVANAQGKRLDESRLDDLVLVVAAIDLPAPASAATAVTPDNGTVSEIERLVQLHEQGALTDDEFGAAKAKLLGL